MPEDTGRNAQTLRILKLLDHMGRLRLGATLPELAEKFGVTDRTIRRDLEAIGELGYEFVKATDATGQLRYKLDAAFAQRIPNAGLTIDELTALLLAFDVDPDGTPYGEQLATARRKIEQALPDRLRAFMADARAELVAHQPPRLTVSSPAQAEHLRQLIAATRAHRVVMLSYDPASAEEPKRYRIEPYRVVSWQGAVYTCAWVPRKSDWRVFALHRILDLTERPDIFEPTHVLPPDPFGNSLGPFIGAPTAIRLVFSSDAARYVRERCWHSSQRARALPDGRLQLSMNVSIDYALHSWILGFGRNVQVAAPDELRAWHRAEAAAMGGEAIDLVHVAMYSRVAEVSDRESRPSWIVDYSEQPPLPFSTGWHPEPPLIVADAHSVDDLLPSVAVDPPRTKRR